MIRGGWGKPGRGIRGKQSSWDIQGRGEGNEVGWVGVRKTESAEFTRGNRWVKWCTKGEKV